MVSNEAVFLIGIVDTWEDQEVAVMDVPGAFMQVDMDELVHICLIGEMVKLLLEIKWDCTRTVWCMKKVKWYSTWNY